MSALTSHEYTAPDRRGDTEDERLLSYSAKIETESRPPHLGPFSCLLGRVWEKGAEGVLGFSLQVWGWAGELKMR